MTRSQTSPKYYAGEKAKDDVRRRRTIASYLGRRIFPFNFQRRSILPAFEFRIVTKQMKILSRQSSGFGIRGR